MKKTIFMLLFVALGLQQALAQNFTFDGLNYTVTSETTASVAGNPGISGAITIPAEVTNNGASLSVTSIGDDAFRGRSGITSVTIPNSVTSIGLAAFYGCSGLTSVTIPNSVTSFGDHSFNGCSGLTSVTIPNSVTNIGSQAFINCSSLTSVTIPNSLTSIGSGVFKSCSGLTSVTIPNSVTNIGKDAFDGCSGLTSVTIPNSVTSIGLGAFDGCSGLTSVTIPNSVTSIGWGAFADCSGLTSVTIPNSVTSIENHTFSDCSGLTSVTIPNSVTSIDRDAFYNCSGLTSVTIPNSVTRIGKNVFDRCSGLTSVTIGNSVTSIGENAFSRCYGLTSVTIPNSVTSIGDYAFEDCTGLKSVLCEIVTPLSINPTVFQGVNQGACSLTVPITSVTAYAAALVWQNFAPICAPTENTTTVTACANYVWANNNQTYTASGTYTGTTTNCVTEKLVLTIISTATDQTNFSSGGLNYVVTSPTTVAVGSNSSASGIINIPASVSNACFDYTVTSIGDDAFIDGSSLTSVTMPNTVTSIGSSAFRRCSSLTSLTIPNSVTSIGSGAFFYCSGLTSVMIPNSVTNIGQNAFNSCSGLISVTIPNSLTSIVQGTFSFCTGLTSVTIPNSLTRIGYGAFQYCTALTSVTIPNSVTSIDEFAFFGCSGLTSVTIPNLVTSISDKSFAFCSGLTSVTIPNSVNSIGDQSFRSCTSLKSITIPNSVTSIGRAAFSYCSGLNSVSIPNSVTSIDYGGFAFCSGLTSVSIPNSVKSIGEYTFYNCIALASVVCEIVTPLSINPNVFEEVNQGACSLTVPVGSIVAYEAAPVWKNFTPISCTPTENTTTVTACNSYFWTNNSQTYTASGTYTGTTTNCVTEKLDLTIDITTAPTASAQSFCAGKTVANLAATGTDIKWYAAETGGTALINETALVTGTTYYASQTLNGCESDRTGVAVTVSQQPTTPGAIAGANTICKNTTVTYSIDPVANATSYQWTLPTGATGTSTSNSIAVTFGSTYTVGDLCVQAVNGACMSATTCMTITPAALVPATPGVIAGPVTIAPNTTKTFTIASVAKASSYAWTAPANATLVSGQGTTSATFNFGLGYTTGLVIVKANNCLGNSATRSLSVKKVGVSAIRGTHCGKTLATIKTPISATIIPGATKYSFEVSINGSVMQTYETTNYYFNLTQLTNMPSYNTTYSIRVAVLFDNVWQNYGTDCTVKTPTLPLLTKLKATQCGTTLALLTSTIAADEIINANKYQFEISKNNTVVQELLSKTYYTSLSTLTTKVQYGTSYTIRVKYSLDNGVTWSEYGTSCSLTTPTLPLTKLKTTQCGSTLALLNSPISADMVINANKYQFKISKDNAVVQELTSSLYYTRLTNLTAGAQNGTTYSIRVRYSFDKGANWSDYGSPCLVTTPSAQGLVLTNQNSPDVSVYPNPFSSTFNVATSFEGEVNVKVIDNIGKLIEQFDIDAGELVTKELGQEYVPGMYHVTVTQEMNSKNFKVVKSH